jgi:hypothetical protein
MTIQSKQDDTSGAKSEPVSEASSTAAPQQVPVRARTRKIYYTRRDISRIYASRTVKEWIQYSCENTAILDYDCITGILYGHPELNSLKQVRTFVYFLEVFFDCNSSELFIQTR